MAGYPEPPLVKKLGVKPEFKMLVRHEPESYWDWLSPLPAGASVKSKAGIGQLDFIHLFVKQRKAFEKEVLQFSKALKSNGMLWISWPKKASGVATDLNENIIREFALKNGLVDIKVCAVDEVWSGLKLVIPIKNRKPEKN